MNNSEEPILTEGGVFLMNMEETTLTNLGYSKNGIELLRRFKNKELTEDEFFEELNKKSMRTKRRKLYEFKVELDSRTDINRRERRNLLQEYKRTLK